jgi:hypothetical protein
MPRELLARCQPAAPASTLPNALPHLVNITIYSSLTYDTYVEISGVAANGTSYSSGRAIVGEHGSV